MTQIIGNPDQNNVARFSVTLIASLLTKKTIKVRTSNMLKTRRNKYSKTVIEWINLNQSTAYSNNQKKKKKS